jgi:hypothetical protein
VGRWGTVPCTRRPKAPSRRCLLSFFVYTNTRGGARGLRHRYRQLVVMPEAAGVAEVQLRTADGKEQPLRVTPPTVAGLQTAVAAACAIAPAAQILACAGRRILADTDEERGADLPAIGVGDGGSCVICVAERGAVSHPEAAVAAASTSAAVLDGGAVTSAVRQMQVSAGPDTFRVAVSTPQRYRLGVHGDDQASNGF